MAKYYIYIQKLVNHNKIDFYQSLVMLKQKMNNREKQYVLTNISPTNSTSSISYWVIYEDPSQRRL